MTRYVIFNNSGEIIRSGECRESDKGFQCREGELLVEGVGNNSTHYVLNGELVEYTAEQRSRKQIRPLFHKWSNESMSWEDLRTLDQIKVEKWAEIKARRDAEQLSGFTWDGSRFQSDLTSQSRIQSAAWAASVDPSFETEWTLADNTMRLLNAADMIEVGIALRNHIDATHTKAQTLRSQVEAAATRGAVEAVSW